MGVLGEKTQKLQFFLLNFPKICNIMGQKREKVNIGRLRIVMMIVCLLTSVFLLALSYFGDSYGIVLTAVFFVALAICGIIANTWAKKK